MLPLVAAAALHLSLAAPPAQPSRPEAATAPAREQSDVGGHPADERARHALFEQKCGKCHSLSVATSSPLTVVQMKRHLKRPGVAVSAVQLHRIVEFLKSDASRRASR